MSMSGGETIKPIGLKFSCQTSPIPVSSGSLLARIRDRKIQQSFVVYPRSRLSLPALNVSCIPSYITLLAGTFSTPINFKLQKQIISDSINSMFYKTVYKYNNT